MLPDVYFSVRYLSNQLDLVKEFKSKKSFQTASKIAGLSSEKKTQDVTIKNQSKILVSKDILINGSLTVRRNY